MVELRCSTHGSPSFPRGRRTGTRHRSPPATGGHGAALPPRARDSGKTQAGTTGVPPWVALRYRPSSPEDPWAGYHAVCLAWLSAGIRAEDAEPGSSYCRRFPGRAPQCHDGFVSITAAGQRRNWTVVRTGFPFQPTARSAPTSTTYRVYRRSQSHKLWWGRSNPARVTQWFARPLARADNDGPSPARPAAAKTREAHVHRPNDRPRPLRQARADPRGPQRADRR